LDVNPSVKGVAADTVAGSSEAEVASSTIPQKPATETTETKASTLNLKAVETSGRTQIIPKEQSPAQGPKQVPATPTNPQAGAQTTAEQSQADSPKSPVQGDKGSSRSSPMENILLPAHKDDLQGIQKGQDVRLELSTVSSDLSTTAESRVLTKAAATPAPENPMAKNGSQDLTEQLGSAMQASLDRHDKQLTVRLQPPELGSVVVRFEEQGQQIKATLEVSRAETGKDIEQALPQVLKNLQEAGLQIRKFDVVVSDPLGKDAGGGSSSHDAWNQQQAWSGTGNHSDGTPRPAWSQWNGRPQDQADLRRAHDSRNVPSQGGIDLLV
jgi:flagellar hook-length control protein FliK